jgi:hypothetical protein
MAAATDPRSLELHPYIRHDPLLFLQEHVVRSPSIRLWFLLFVLWAVTLR